MATPIKHDSNTDIFQKQLFVFVNERPIAFGISATLDVGSSSINIDNKMISGGWEGVSPGTKNWSVSSESLVTFVTGQLSADDLLDIMIKDEKVEIIYGRFIVTDETPAGGIFEPDLTKSHYKGEAIIESFNVSSSVGDIAKCSITLKGSGALEKIEPTPTT